MRKLIVFSCLFVFLSTLQATAYTIDDNYIGSDPTHNWAHTDVIGEYKYYDVEGMNVNTGGSSMKVDIYTSFVSQTSSTAIWTDQTKIGDLFIGTGGWKPFGTASNKYLYDNATNNQTIWDYVVVLTPHIPVAANDSTKKGTATIYSTNDGNFVKSNIGTLDPRYWVYRSDQYVQFNPDANATALYTGTWNIIDNAKTINGISYGDLQINIDYSDIIAESSDWAFHWAMTCANDVIEGQTHVPSVPEPGTIFLLGGGMIGVALFAAGRRKNLH